MRGANRKELTNMYLLNKIPVNERLSLSELDDMSEDLLQKYIDGHHLMYEKKTFVTKSEAERREELGRYQKPEYPKTKEQFNLLSIFKKQKKSEDKKKEIEDNKAIKEFKTEKNRLESIARKRDDQSQRLKIVKDKIKQQKEIEEQRHKERKELQDKKLKTDVDKRKLQVLETKIKEARKIKEIEIRKETDLEKERLRNERIIKELEAKVQSKEKDHQRRLKEREEQKQEKAEQVVVDEKLRQQKRQESKEDKEEERQAVEKLRQLRRQEEKTDKEEERQRIRDEKSGEMRKLLNKYETLEKASKKEVTLAVASGIDKMDSGTAKDLIAAIMGSLKARFEIPEAVVDFIILGIEKKGKLSLLDWKNFAKSLGEAGLRILENELKGGFAGMKLLVKFII